MNELYLELLRKFRANISNNTRLANLKITNFEDVKKYAELVSDELMYLLRENIDLGSFTQELGDQVVEPLIRECYRLINQACRDANLVLIDELGMSLNPAEAIYDVYNAYEVVNVMNKYPEFTEEAIQEILKTMYTANNRVVDSNIRSNAEFMDDAGMKVTVTRIYDGRGLHGGKDRCKWCLERCGTDVPYHEALSRGMFERHNGCGCTIIYKTARGTTYQDSKGKWYNESERQARIKLANE